MHTVVVTYILPRPTPRAEVMEKFKASEKRFRSVPHLIRKYYCYDEANHTGHSVYLWESKPAADAFFSKEFVDAFRQSFGTTPEFLGVDTLMIVDNAVGETVYAKAEKAAQPV